MSELLFLLVPASLWIGGVLLLPYLCGIMLHHLLSRNWAKFLGWLIISLLSIFILYAFLGSGPRSVGNGPLQWFMLGQMVCWWALWFHYYRKGETSGWQTVGGTAFIISLVFALHGSFLITAVVLLILLIRTANEKREVGPVEIAPSRRANVEDGENQAARMGCRPYPNAEYVDVVSRVVARAGEPGKSYKLRFRTPDSPDQVLDFYRKGAESGGLTVRRGTRVADDPSIPPVPGLVAEGRDGSVLVVWRDSRDEFTWNVTIWFETWPSFKQDILLYFHLDEPLCDLSAAPEEVPRPMEGRVERIREILHDRGAPREEVPARPPAQEPVYAAPVEGGEHPEEPPTMEERKAALPPRPRRGWDWSLIETYAPMVFAWIAVVIIVLGLGFYLSLEYGVIGKVISVYSVFILLWSAGLWYERRPRFSTFGRALIAGGWAGIYLTTFLIHYLPQARLITDPNIGTLILMGIAAGMIGHSFKYRSQSLTTLTYSVAFVTVALSVQLSDQRFFSLVATAVLAVSMLFILARLQWFWVALFSVIGCYASHFIWLRPLLPSFEMRGGIGGEFWPGLLMLILYWSTSTVAVYLFKPKDRREDTYSLYLSALNFVLFFFLARYQVGAEHPELRMFIIEALALAYVGLVFLSNYLRRQNLYTLNLVTAALCTTMSLYYLLDKGNWVAIGWLIQAEALYIAGLLADETRFRVIGAANFVLVGIWLITVDYNVPDQAHCSG